MNLEQTYKYLKYMGILRYEYTDNGLGLGQGECMRIAFDYEPGEGWTVFYAERGIRGLDFQRFSSEEAACDAFIKEVMGSCKRSMDSIEYHRIHNTEYFQKIMLHIEKIPVKQPPIANTKPAFIKPFFTYLRKLFSIEKTR